MINLYPNTLTGILMNTEYIQIQLNKGHFMFG